MFPSSFVILQLNHSPFIKNTHRFIYVKWYFLAQSCYLAAIDGKSVLNVKDLAKEQIICLITKWYL